MDSIGARIRYARKQAGLTQAELATALKTSNGHIGDKEANRSKPSYSFLIAIEIICGVSADWLLTGSGDPTACRYRNPPSLNVTTIAGQEPLAQPGVVPAGKDYVDLPAWNQAPLDDEERELMGCALDVLRSGDKLPNVATALETSIKSLRDTVERDANRPRPRAPSWESPGSQKQASGGGQQGKRRANGSD